MRTVNVDENVTNATTRFIGHENKRNVGICWAKSLTGFKLDATYVNIMQHSPTFAWGLSEQLIDQL